MYSSSSIVRVFGYLGIRGFKFGAYGFLEPQVMLASFATLRTKP